MKTRYIIAFFLLILLFSVSACRKTSDEEKIQSIITKIQKAAEEKESSTIMEHISLAYSDSQGFGYETLKRTLRGYFFRFPRISTFINKRDISIEGENAKVALQAILTSGKTTGSITDAIPESLGVYIFNVSLKKESSDWKIVSATWKRVGEENYNN
ncbi:MAG: hypothetical protein ACYDHW_11730 [Syntrophorhabdaceae bacterium]